ncbi:MAG: hypothetical protein C0623_04830 [Desulfuromonas sp.]|nr:MAG: hypothetical protein C0623_04830 [Desulfuromonas sp.]
MKDFNKRNILNRLFEGIVAIALVLVSFFVLIMVFNAIFPEGSGLTFIFRTPTERAGLDRAEPAELLVARGDHADSLSGDNDWAATLELVRNSVKSKKANAIAWRNAQQGMQLSNLDAVQTLDQSSAVIKFDDNNVIDLGSNSLIVIRRMEKDLLFKEKRSFMVVVDGQLRGRLGGDDAGNVYLEVTTPNAVARLQSNPEDREGIEFKIDVNEDTASAVTIYSGSGEVEARGETVTVGKNQVTRIEGDLAPTEPVTLPDPVRLKSPVEEASFPYRSLPPRVRLTWQRQTEVSGYHLLLARNADFTEILIDQSLRQPEFVHGNLRAGEYFWKVSSINNAGEGSFSAVRRFYLHQDQTPPKLEVQFPAETVSLKTSEITGVTEPDATIFISGTEITPGSDGRFRHQLALNRGINIVVVEAVDPAGNISYQSQLVHGKY